MPPTSDQPSKLQQQLAEAQAAGKANDKRCRELEAAIERRQNEFEDLTKRFCQLMTQGQTIEKQVEAANKSRDTFKSRLEQKVADYQELQGRYNELQSVSLLSDDEKITKIARLEKELVDAKGAEQAALKKVQGTDSMLDYTKEQYRLAQESASTYKEQVDTLTAELEVARRKASGEATELKKLHLDRSFATVKGQCEKLRTEKKLLEKVLHAKEEEIARLKNSRSMGVGTRAQSVGPKTPRPGSRAASPLPRDRVSNLRNG